MNEWSTILSSGTASVLLSGALTFLFRNWISSRIRASIAHEYKTKEEHLRAELQGHLEGVRAGYQKVLDENQIRFSKLHVDQAEALKALYSQLADEYSVLLRLTAAFKPGTDEQMKERDESLGKKFGETHNAALCFFLQNRLLLPLHVCEDVDRFLQEAKSTYHHYTAYDGLYLDGEGLRDMYKTKAEANTKVREDLEKVLHGIENSFRQMLGVQPQIC